MTKETLSKANNKELPFIKYVGEMGKNEWGYIFNVCREDKTRVCSMGSHTKEEAETMRQRLINTIP